MLTFTQMRAEHDDALSATTRLLSGIDSGEVSLTSPTPCAGWDLADLLGHMIGQNLGFAAAVTAGDAPATAYASVPVTTGDASRAWQESAATVREAFGAADPAATVHLSEFGFRPTVEVALGMQLLDAAVHAWDVATAVGADHRPAPDTVAHVLEMARQIAARPGGTPVFAAPSTETGDDPWADALRLLGRQAA
ncbi:uncharacterized protein (TIGR03086 family) [Nocardioides albertanoniae]|uniref:Uncharacterized protein (TIGR03086 family) n=1 Tax=Nocardioides albertanoniae TaxID=1175486 RepID=A0A543A748_9ACTN|nr:TIGR03086 family metal-binding protein [Nocardioides albertanoniae]TQL68431.1 uncharacterized protein (TIGR03086 family) [Nocardioides albertanoniae]